MACSSLIGGVLGGTQPAAAGSAHSVADEPSAMPSLSLTPSRRRFAILDRMTGDWSVLDTEWGQAYFLFPIVLKGELWWLAMSFITWLIGGIFILSLLKAKKDAELGMVGITVVIERAVHMRQFSRWIQTKAVAEEHVDASDIEVVTEYKYDEEASGGW